MNQKQAEAAISNAVKLENLSSQAVRNITPELRRIFVDIGQAVSDLPAGGIERDLYFKELERQFPGVFRHVNNQFYGELKEAVTGEAPGQAEYAERILTGGGTTPSITANEITPTQIVGASQKTEVMGQRLETLFGQEGNASKWIQSNIKRIDQAVKQGFLTGMTNQQIGMEIRSIQGTSIREANAIARTAVMDMSARAQEQYWDANSDRIAGWEFDSTMDNRLCDQCAPWDGRTAKKRYDLPTTPVHVNCRCRALPLTATELALREQEGPQRRSVVEIIPVSNDDWAAMKKAKNPSERKAIRDQLRAKVEKGQTGGAVKAARSYAEPVTIKGKRYWRVAKDIEQPNHPLTMGEFLKGSSRATKVQVLGSEKKANAFMSLVKGTSTKAPLTPDAALRKVLNFGDTAVPAPSKSRSILQSPLVQKTKVKPYPKAKVVAAAKASPKRATPKQPQTAKDLFIDSPEVAEFMSGTGGTGSAADKVLTALSDEPVRKRNIDNLKRFIRKNDIIENFTFADEDITKNLKHYSGDKIKKIAASQRKTVEQLKKQGWDLENRKTAEYLLERLEAGDTSVLPDMLKPLSGTKGYTRQSQGVVNISMPRNAALGKKKDLIDRIKGSLRQSSGFAKTGKGELPFATYAEVDPRQEWIAVMLHETGHQVHYRGINAGKFIGSKFQVKGQLASVSRYGLLNEKERFAEAFVQYILNPEGLKKEASGLYNWVDDALKRAIQ